MKLPNIDKKGDLIQMNEKQRLESQQVESANSSDKKSAKDYSKYFEQVITAPSLKDAKKRGKEEVKYHNDFAIPEEFRGMGKGESFIFVHMAVK